MPRPLTGIRADRKHSYASIEGIASGLRQALGLGKFDRFDSRQFFDQVLADVTLQTSKGEIQLREAIDDCPQEGSTRWDEADGLLEIVLSPATYALLQADHVRARSTVAHECGHACLHTEQIIRMTGLSLQSRVALHRERGAHEACQDTEWQANAFGSSLLMPASGIAEIVSQVSAIEQIAHTYGVSKESATYRIETYRRSLGLK